MSEPRVTLYTRPGCHLCEDARALIEQVCAELDESYAEVSIADDADLERRYRERIPVVLVDGEEAFTYFVHPDGLRRRLGA